MRVLVACEFSGIMRDAFTNAGYHAVSCDLLPSETEGPHYCGDVLNILDMGWDMMLACPPCTYLCGSGLHWNGRVPGRAEKTEHALNFVHTLLNAPIGKICIENPVGCISTRLMRASQYVQPYQFGHDASKKTGLWLIGLPRLLPTVRVSPRMVAGKPRWGNQTDSGQNALTPGVDRWKERSRTYTGIAHAMLEQWG